MMKTIRSNTAMLLLLLMGSNINIAQGNSNITTALPSSADVCFDYLDWTGYQDMTCLDYEHDRSLCSTKGYIRDIFSHPDSYEDADANHSCCACGGGYTGDLINQTFRIGYHHDTIPYDILYTDPDTNERRGSIHDFMFAASRRLGVTLEEVPEYSGENSNYKKCLEAMDEGDLDICIGMYQSISDLYFFLSHSLNLSFSFFFNWY